jgi:hypothetical protein
MNLEDTSVNFNSIKHRSIESATKSNLVIKINLNMFHLTFNSIKFIIFGIIFEIVVRLLINMNDGIIKYFGFALLIIGVILIFILSIEETITMIIGVLFRKIISIIFRNISLVLRGVG